MLQVLRNAAVRRIAAAAVVSQIGDWSARLAIAFIVLDETGLASGVGVAGALFVLPWLGPGQWLAGFGDRMDRIRLLVGCELGRAGLYGLLALGTGRIPVWLLLSMVAVIALIDPVWESNRSALIVDATSEEDYPAAVKLIQSANQAATLVGWAVGGVLVATVGSAATLGINAGTFVLSGLLIAGISSSGQTIRTERSGSFAAARRYFERDHLSAAAVLATALLIVAAMAIETQAPVYGRFVGLSEGWIGVMIAMIPLVTLLTVLVIPTKPSDETLLQMGFGSGAIAALASVAAFSTGGADVISFIGYGGVGAAFGASTVANIVVGRRLPSEERASVFSVIQGAIFISLSGGSLVGGVASDLIGVRTASVVCALVVALACFGGAAYSKYHAVRHS